MAIQIRVGLFTQGEKKSSETDDSENNGREKGRGGTVNPAFEPDADRNESFCQGSSFLW